MYYLLHLGVVLLLRQGALGDIDGYTADSLRFMVQLP